MLPPALVDAAFLLVVVVVVAVVIAGFAHAARASVPSEARAPGRAALAASCVLLAVAAADIVAARTGWTGRWEQLPPRIPTLALGALLTAGMLLCVPPARDLARALPGVGLVAFQTFRLPLELLLWALAEQERLPPQMTFEGRNLDVLVGLSAPAIAWALSRGLIGWRTVIAWNVASLGLLINVTAVAIRSAPGPLHAFPEAAPLTLVASLPYTFLPGLLVPSAYLGHFLSLRWAFAERARAESRERSASRRDDVPA